MDNGAGDNWKLCLTGQLGSEDSPVQTGAAQTIGHNVSTALLLSVWGEGEGCK